MPRFALSHSPIAIEQLAQPKRPFTVAGESGAVFGQQDGSFELWQFPVKVLSHFHIIAEVADYPVPIDLNQQAGMIEVNPDHTTITYSHAAITVKQHMFAARGSADTSTGAIVLFELAAVRPATLTLQFEPIMMNQWPAPSHGKPSASWFALADGGGYLLATDDPRMFGAVAMPRARPGIMLPYQERPKTYPVEFKLSFDPKKDSGLFFPLIAAVADRSIGLEPDTAQSLVRKVADIDAHIPDLYRNTRAYYDHFFDDKLTVETPDHRFDAALRWAELSIDQTKVRRQGETGLVAGWSPSGDSARPGFGWFFGRDALWSLYALHSYGDFALARQAVEFLVRRQRSDGKIIHEYSQTADLVDWHSLPYEFAAADSTPLFVMAMEDYVRATGDMDFLRRYWQNVKLAYQFTRTHDSDGDGIYDNGEGTGWVESWPLGKPHQELYLAALDQQSAEAMSRLALLLGEYKLSLAASRQANAIRTRLADYRTRDSAYAFSRNSDGSYDTTPTVFPTVAWWNGRLQLPDAEQAFSRWASADFSTDWGTRAVAASSPIYDPISYHQGSVWPLFTGWTSLAEYRSGRVLAGYSHLMANANLTWSQDLGAVTELLSGQIFEPLGRSSSHQLWSSSMVLSPAIRGLFGIEPDVLHKNLRVFPSLPANWDHATIHNVPYGNTRLEVTMSRHNQNLVIDAQSRENVVVCLLASASPVDSECHQTAARQHTATIPLPAVELSLVDEQPKPGSETMQLKVLQQQYSSGRLTLKLSAPARSVKRLRLRVNAANKKLTIIGADVHGDDLAIKFPEGNGYQNQTVEIRW